MSYLIRFKAYEGELNEVKDGMNRNYGHLGKPVYIMFYISVLYSI